MIFPFQYPPCIRMVGIDCVPVLHPFIVYFFNIILASVPSQEEFWLSKRAHSPGASLLCTCISISISILHSLPWMITVIIVTDLLPEILA